MKQVVTLILIFVLCASAVHSQTVDQDDVIRVETDVTNLPFTAMDKERRFITTLRAEDVRVLEDGVPQKLFTFQRETDRPLAIAFLIDVSASQEIQLSRRESRGEVVYRESDPIDERSSRDIPFTDLPYLEQAMTRDMLSVYQVLQSMEVAAPAYLGCGRPLSGIPTGPGLLARSAGRQLLRLGCSGADVDQSVGERSRSAATSDHPVVRWSGHGEPLEPEGSDQSPRLRLKL